MHIRNLYRFLLLGTMFALMPAEAQVVCEQKIATVKVSFQDLAVSEDDTRSLAYLQSLSGKAMDQHHHVLGLTHAEPMLSYEVKAIISAMPEGIVCMMPEVTIKAGFSNMQVYLAREIEGDCRRQIIRDHEFEHVSTWKSYLRAGSKMMEAPLTVAFSIPRQYDTVSQAEQDLRPWAEKLIKPMEQKLLASAALAQREIDSPMSYNYVETRLRSCPR